MTNTTTPSPLLQETTAHVNAALAIPTTPGLGLLFGVLKRVILRSLLTVDNTAAIVHQGSVVAEQTSTTWAEETLITHSVESKKRIADLDKLLNTEVGI